MKRFNLLRNHTFLKIFVIPLIYNSTASMTWAISVLYARELQATLLQINLITTIFSIMSILFQVPFGILSDRYGRKAMLLIPQSIMLLGTLIRAIATEANHLIIASIFGGFAGGAFFPILLSMIADVAEPKERQEAIGILFFFSSVGMVIGPTVGSLLLEYSLINLRNIYQINAICQGVMLVYIFTQITETKPASSRSHITSYRKQILTILQQRNIKALLVMAFLYFFNFSILNTYIPVYAQESLNLTDSEVTSFSTFRNLAILFIRLSTISIFSHISPKRYLIIVLLIGGFAGLYTSQAADYSSLVLIHLLSGTSFGATMILGSTLLAENTTSKNRGIANSLYNFSQSAGSITKLATTPIVENQGAPTVFVLGGIATMSSVLPILLIQSQKKGAPPHND